MSRRFDSLLRDLAKATSSDRVCNPWSDDAASRDNRVRRRNLRRYLRAIDELSPRMLLVGEALGHRGGRITGVPFVSPRLLFDAGHPLLGEHRGYRRPSDHARIDGEATATMIWDAIRTIDPPPLLWNAFPFHPHRPGLPATNRPPSAAEIREGSRFLLRIIRLFDLRDIVAVGRSASKALAQLDISHKSIRHPSLGGKREFLAGLRGCVSP
jgi:uracil-DNA glycosylase